MLLLPPKFIRREKMRILLNTLIRENYSFFDADSRACLDLSCPGAIVDRVTPAIKRGILAGTIIDVDNESGIEIGEKQKMFNAAYLRAKRIAPKEEVKEIKEEEQEENTEAEIKEETKKNKNKKKDGE